MSQNYIIVNVLEGEEPCIVGGANTLKEARHEVENLIDTDMRDNDIDTRDKKEVAEYRLLLMDNPGTFSIYEIRDKANNLIETISPAVDMEKEGIFLRIGWINHARYVGFDIETDECRDFLPGDAKNYRGAKNADELKIAEQTALNFYNKRKGERRGAFGTKQVTRELLTYNSSIGYTKPEYLFDGQED